VRGAPYFLLATLHAISLLGDRASIAHEWMRSTVLRLIEAFF
jgi:hypothetical protein